MMNGRYTQYFQTWCTRLANTISLPACKFISDSGESGSGPRRSTDSIAVDIVHTASAVESFFLFKVLSWYELVPRLSGQARNLETARRALGTKGAIVGHCVE